MLVLSPLPEHQVTVIARRCTADGSSYHPLFHCDFQGGACSERPFFQDALKMTQEPNCFVSLLFLSFSKSEAAFCCIPICKPVLLSVWFMWRWCLSLTMSHRLVLNSWPLDFSFPGAEIVGVSFIAPSCVIYFYVFLQVWGQTQSLCWDIFSG